MYHELTFDRGDAICRYCQDCTSTFWKIKEITLKDVFLNKYWYNKNLYIAFLYKTMIKGTF